MYKLLRSIVISVLSLCLLVTVRLPVRAEACALEVSSSASAAVLFEPSSGTVLYEKNAHVKRPMASTTKLMTALLTAECLPPDRVVTVSEDALHVIGTSLGLKAGDRITVRDLLCGLLLASGNDAANVLALETDGSQEAYAARMNARAAAIGMTNSRFVTPSGLDADGHGASAYDMALLAAEVLNNEMLASICATTTAEIKISDRVYAIRNHNRLLTELDGCIGMKTGYTSQSGRCLVSAATRNGVTLIAVTLDCANDWEEHRVLMEEGFACLERVTLESPPLRAVPVFGGAEAAVMPLGEPFSVTRLRDEESPEAIVKLYPYVWAPIRAGDRLGTVEYRAGGTTLATIPLVASTAVEERPRASWLTRTGQLFYNMLKEMLSG